MRKDKIIHNNEINLLNLFKLIWRNIIPIIIYLFSISLAIIYNQNKSEIFKISIK